jgi:hypothetical protein
MSDHSDLLDTWIQDLGFDQPDLPWKVYAAKAELRDLVQAARGEGINKGHENALADAERNFQAGVRKGQRDERERIDAIDFTYLFRRHTQNGYVCSCGAELNEMATHMANVIHRAIAGEPPA